MAMRSLSLWFVLAFIGARCGESNAQFVRLGRLYPEHTRSKAQGMSAGGTVVVGSSGGSGGNPNHAFLWTIGDGLTDLLPDALGSAATAVSANGDVIVGDSSGAYRWRLGEGAETIDGLDSARDVSADGSIVVGVTGSESRNNGDAQAYLWHEVDGLRPLGFLPGSTMSSAGAVSADGLVVVGRSGSGDPSSSHILDLAFRWTDANGMQPLGHLGGNYASPTDVSAHGEIIVGSSETPDGVHRAFRWNEAEGMVALGSLDEHGLSSGATAVSADGKTIVGWAVAEDARGIRTRRAFLWDEDNGMRDFEKLLVDEFGQATALAGWSIDLLYDVSPDGRVFVGSARTPDKGGSEGFIFYMDPLLRAGDADQNLVFDQLDLVQVQVVGKYLTDQPTTWGEGDWDGAPGGKQGSPPQGNGLFDQLDIISALSAGVYLTGPYGAVALGGGSTDGQTSLVYDPSTGEVAVDGPSVTELTSINIDSAAAIFTGDAAQNLGGSFDNDADDNIFKATFGGSFGSISFGNVALTGLSPEFVAADLTVVGSLAGGGALGDVDLIYVPEPSTATLLGLALLIFVRLSRRKSENDAKAALC